MYIWIRMINRPPVSPFIPERGKIKTEPEKLYAAGLYWAGITV